MTRTLKRKLHIRTLSLLLVMLNLLSMMPMPTHSTEIVEETIAASPMFNISLDGTSATVLTICAYDKKEITVEGNVSAESYQWQISHPEKSGLWINIYDATSGYLPVTLALVKNMLDRDNTAQLRCCVKAAGVEYNTAPIMVVYNEEDDGIPVILADLAVPAIPEETVPETTVPEETVPETTVPEETVPETTIPEETVPETTVPEETVPETSVPEERVPETTVPEETASEEVIPEVIVTAETVSETETMAAAIVDAKAETASEETEAEAPVIVVADELVVSAPAMEAAEGEQTSAPAAEGDAESGDEQNKEYVSVTINYMRYDYAKDVDGKLMVDADGNPVLNTTGVQAFTSYVATLQYGMTFEETTVPSPYMVGYDRYRGDDATAGSGDTITIAETVVTDDITIEVKYKPANVNYAVRYYFQNIYDDQYIEDATILPSAKAQGHTGSVPPESIIKPNVPGFTCLYYEPDFIAADGSTVFAAYFERNYYLMEFDCDGGYGADTLYVRYGTYISVPNPVRSGYVFDYWELTHKDQLDANGNQVLDADGKPTLEYVADGEENDADALPDDMPRYNSAYIAIWTNTDTTYTVAYWLKNGNEVTYLGGYLKGATTGSRPEYTDDLGYTGIGAVCGLYGHTHTVNCFKCKNLNHEHEETCFSCGMVNHTHTKANCYAGNPEKHSAELTATTGDTAGWNAILQVNEGLVDPTETYLYFTGAKGSDTYWPKMFVDGKLFQVYLDGKQSINVADLSKYVDGDPINSIIYNNDFAVKYRIKMTCGKPEHSHTEACSECGTHEHTLDCRQDSHYLDYLEDETIKANEGKIVEGDGSTVVNVYYSYKTYTLRYYYAKRMNNEVVTDENGNAVTDENGNKVKGVFYVVGGTTWPFGGSNKDASESTTVIELLGKVSAWGAVKSEPKIKSEYLTGDTKRYDTGTVTTNDGSITYYYLEYKAIYGQDLENLWPVDIFEPVEIKGSHSNRPGLKYAYFSAWNGEACTKYSTDVRDNNLHGGNYTIKGLYMQLDEHIIFDRQYSIKAETTLVSYLGFWENGDNTGWSNPKKFQYHIMKKSTDKENVPGKTYKTYNETKYELYTDFTVYDNNTLSETWQQTAVGLPGYTNVGVEFDNASYYQDFTSDNPTLQSVDYYFYYDPSIHIITFWNHSEYLSDGTGSNISFGTDLKLYGQYATGMVYNAQTNPKGRYPRSLEPGAYKFDGWYTTAQCLPGTEMNWDQKMPDSDFVVYANWVPVTRNVRYYLTYSDMLAGDTWEATDIHGDPVQYPIVVDHGSELGTAFNFIPTRKETVNGKEVEYRFVGWFYMDENNKKRFAPESMRVDQDLELFAEWSTIIDTTYEIRYVLEEDCEVSGKTYKAGDPVADATLAHATVGLTKSFNAKTLGDLYPDFQESFFPTTNSHSILMALDSTKNIHTFTYVYDPEVYYEVRYVDYVSKTELMPSVVKKTQKAIVTEKFLPISGYIPDNFYITKTLAADGTSTKPIEENVITFYYVADTKHGLYAIEYYLENTDSNNENDVNNYHYHESDVGTVELDPKTKQTLKTAEYRTYAGYEYVTAMNTVINYSVNKDANGNIVYDSNGQPVITETKKEGTAAGNPPKGYVDEGGLTIRIYYKRKTYPYIIEYRDSAADATAPALKTLTNQNSKAKLDSLVTYSLVSGTRDDRTIHVNGKTYEYYIPNLEANDPELTKTMTISYYDSGDPNPNKLIFYFVQKQVEVQYHTVCTVPVAQGLTYGVVSLNKESGSDPAKLKGATATAAEGFLFKGWYSDEACTKLVTENAAFKPTTLSEDLGWVHHYYAKFEPITKDLTIYKSAVQGQTLDSKDSFLFKISGTDAVGRVIDMTVSVQGSGSVTVKDLYCGEYTVTELTEWSWTYSNTSQATANVDITSNGDDAEVTFVNAPNGTTWLHGEANNENQFKH